MKKIFLFLIISSFFNIKSLSKEIEIEDKESSYLGVIRGIYMDGRIGHKDNIFFVSWF